MSNFSRFSFDNYTPKYPSEEARITDYLSNLRDVAPQSIYNVAFACLVKNDKENLADLLYKLYARIDKIQQLFYVRFYVDNRKRVKRTFNGEKADG